MAEEKRHIENMGFLDLTGIKSPEDLADIASMKNVGAILVPEDISGAIMGALMKVPMKNVGAVIPVPRGANVKVQTGQVKMSGEALANPGGGEDDILVLVGQAIVTSKVERVGFKELHVIGQLLAPRGSQEALGPKIKRLTGQMLYYPLGARIFIGEQSFSREFFELLPGPTPLVLVGEFEMGKEVSPDLLKEKVPEIVLVGELRASKELVPLLQVLTVENIGEIKAYEERVS